MRLLLEKNLVYGEDDRVNYAKPPTTLLELFSGIKYQLSQTLSYIMAILILWLIMYNQSMVIVPYVVMGPGLFTGAMTLGILNPNLKCI